MIELKDNFGRVHDYLRLSLTDICNLNCTYCNPVSLHESVASSNLLDVGQMLRLAELFAGQLGIKKIRLTGGEPLAGRGIEQLLEGMKELKTRYGTKLFITTNGILLKKYLPLLKAAGLDGINISLDSLKRETYQNITKHDSLDRVLEAINMADEAGFEHVKINCVLMRGVNDSEIPDFIEYFGNRKVTLRFIEYMPFAENGWNNGSFIGSDEMIQRLYGQYEIKKTVQTGNGVSRDYTIAGKKCSLGFISSISNHFCDSCNRLRITSTGRLRLCLFGSRESELDLKQLMKQSGISNTELAEAISAHMHKKAYKHPPVEQLQKMDFNYMLKAGG